MPTLVTGGFGAIGAWVVRDLLEADEDVTVFSRTDRRGATGLDRPQLRVELGDVTDAAAVIRVLRGHGITRVCHLAGMVTNPEPTPAPMIATNLLATINLLEASRVCGVETFVMASSKAVYGPPTGRFAHPTYDPVPEAASLNPHGFYGATKAAAEVMARSFAAEHGICTTLLRFGSTFGPGKLAAGGHGSFGVVSSMIESALAGRPFHTAGADQVSDYIYYPDVSRAIVLALSRRTGSAETLNVATGTGLSLYQIADLVRARFPEADLTLAPGLRYRENEPSMAFVLQVERARLSLGFSAEFDMSRAISDYAARLASR